MRSANSSFVSTVSKESTMSLQSSTSLGKFNHGAGHSGGAVSPKSLAMCTVKYFHILLQCSSVKRGSAIADRIAGSVVHHPMACVLSLIHISEPTRLGMI